MFRSVPLAAAAALLFGHAAAAAVTASATTDLNLRSGPDPSFPVLSVITTDSPVTINGCISGSMWCMVDAGGMQGWAYAAYLTADLAGIPAIVGDQVVALGIPAVTYTAAAPTVTVASAAAPVTPPFIFGNTVDTPASIVPPRFVQTFIMSTPQASITLPGTVAIGTTLPAEDTLYAVPAYQYAYAYVNGMPVLVDPATREIVYVLS